MKKLLFCACALAGTILHAKEYPNLAVSNIPESLKSGAHAVYRYDTTVINVMEINKVKLIQKYAVTILDEKGLQYAQLLEVYDNNTTINDLDAYLLDASGKEIKSLKNREVYDYSVYGASFEFNTDRRYKIFDFQHKAYPYTIIFSINKTYKSQFFLPDWMVQNNTDCSVMSSYLSLSFPSKNPIRWKACLLPENTQKSQSNSTNDYENLTWSVSNLPVIKKQPNSKVGNFEVPNIQLSPTKFQLYGHEGEISTWKNFGGFIYKLNEGRDDLTPAKQEMVKTLVANEKTTYDKIQKLYAYMQQSTRYVADEYGISGWQTFDAKDVARTGYGDCKGLVNYLKALLKAADIKAYTTLVFAGAENHLKLDKDFPANNFNHVILCVPQAKDSIWIECTSQELPAGYLGKFTQNRDVLITTENGGMLAHTPTYSMDNNFAIRKATLLLNRGDIGGPVITIENQYFGPMQDNMTHFVKTKTEKEIREIVNAKFLFPTYTVNKYDYKNGVDDNHLPSLTETVEVEPQGIISGTQKRTFINLAWMRNPMTDLFQVEERTLPIVLGESFAVTDSVVVVMPEGMEIESMPSDKNVKYPFAEYTLHFEKRNHEVLMTRKFIQKEGIYDVAMYQDYQKMYKGIQVEKDKLQIVVLNKAL